jgi:pyridoxine/pyridoxamine 5'-phosphate oxidase
MAAGMVPSLQLGQAPTATVTNLPTEAATRQPEPLRLRWLAEAQAAGVDEPGAVAFVTVGCEGRPSARTVLLKRLEDDALVFTSALWTRKARGASRSMTSLRCARVMLT